MRVTYTYECEKCGHRERWTGIRDKDGNVPETLPCPVKRCKGTMRKQFPKPAVHNRLKRSI